MCGRYRLSRRAEVLAAYYAEYEGVDWDAHYNIAPTQSVPVIRQDPSQPIRRASLLRWGLIPSWAKDGTIGVHMINARAETAAEKPAFQRMSGASPLPHSFRWLLRMEAERKDWEPFAFAGLWDRWQAQDGTTLETCTILTTAANQLLADIHDRMPVILSPESYDLWLDPGFRDVAAAFRMALSSGRYEGSESALNFAPQQ
jgi:putative SOS response-associated peptidase YedK